MTALPDAETKRRIKAAAPRRLGGHRPLSARAWFDQLGRTPEADLPIDVYGSGGACAVLEREVAELLEKPAAVFVPKGMIAQFAALRTWSERANRRTVGLHPSSHMDLDEANALEILHPLRAVRIGARFDPFTAAEVTAVREPLAVVAHETPLRRAGFKLLSWADYIALADAVAARGCAFHLDGARLWESAPFYGKSLAEIAAPAASVYVSLYKGLGGLGGAVLLGEPDFIAETRIWLSRHGAFPYHTFPYALAGLHGLRTHLPWMAGWRARALEIAAALKGIDGVTTTPATPHTNAFQVYLPGAPAALERAHLALTERRGVWLFEAFTASPVANLTMAEVQVYSAAEDLTTQEIVDLVAELLEEAAREAAAPAPSHAA